MLKTYVNVGKKLIRSPLEPIIEKVIQRSRCRVQVAAIIVASNDDIIQLGWNNMGTGLGIHAECHAISRADKERLPGATIYVAAKRRDRRKSTLAKPCEACQALIDKWGLRVVYRDGEGIWWNF